MLGLAVLVLVLVKSYIVPALASNVWHLVLAFHNFVLARWQYGSGFARMGHGIGMGFGFLGLGMTLLQNLLQVHRPRIHITKWYYRR